MAKKIFMIAGPNGAGKTTSAVSLTHSVDIIDEYTQTPSKLGISALPKPRDSTIVNRSILLILTCLRSIESRELWLCRKPSFEGVWVYINADDIARGLAPLHPESMSLTASKLMVKRLKELLANQKSFAFETTASGTNYIKHLKEAQSNGYEIHLIFLWLSSPDLAVNRVTKRVAQGGHYIPQEIIRRRYRNGLFNFIRYYLPLADRAIVLDNSDECEKIIAFKNQQKNLEIYNSTIWKEIEKHG